MYHQEENNYGLVEVDGDTVKPLPDFQALKEKITKVHPQGVSMSSYTPSNTEPRNCPAEGNAWQASTNLPPTPDKGVCQCKLKALDCTAKSSVKEDAIGELFGFVCGQPNTDCSGIEANGTTGQYGAFSMCSPSERLAWAFNSYYQANGKNSQACDFNGNATTQTAQTDSSCESAIQKAESSSTPPTSSGGSSGSSSSPSPSGNSAPTSVQPLNYTFWLVSTLIMASVFAGAMSVIV